MVIFIKSQLLTPQKRTVSSTSHRSEILHSSIFVYLICLSSVEKGTMYTDVLNNKNGKEPILSIEWNRVVLSME